MKVILLLLLLLLLLVVIYFLLFLCCLCYWPYGSCANALIIKNWTLIIIIIIIIIDFSCHRPFLPGTSLEPAVIPTAQASSLLLLLVFTLLRWQIRRIASQKCNRCMYYQNMCNIWRVSHSSLVTTKKRIAINKQLLSSIYPPNAEPTNSDLNCF